jgi:Protein of unknown function (DUF4235)
VGDLPEAAFAFLDDSVPASSRSRVDADDFHEGKVRTPSDALEDQRCQIHGDGHLATRMARVLYKPIGLFVSVLGGLVAGAVFKRIWRVAADESEAPKATDERRSWREVTAAAAAQGAVYGAVKALIDRAGATGFARLTGSWPGSRET